MATAAEILQRARARAGLSQRELAKRAGTSQSVVARIEQGTTSPTWETLERLLAAAGEELSPNTQPADGSMLYELPYMLRMTPEQRLQGVANVSDFLYRARRVSDGGQVPGATTPLDPRLLFTTLARHGVQFVVIGALGATMQGLPRNTCDADITPAPGTDNLARLAAALRELEARSPADELADGLPGNRNLTTRAGRLNLIFEPAGTTGFADLAAHAVRFELDGYPLLAASLEDIIRMKPAAGRT
jgi:transcriptional regulator with XRE-family HTH domain